MVRVSVIIPSRNCSYVNRTVEDAFAKAKGAVEVIVLYDGWEPQEPLKPRKNLEIFHSGQQIGMRAAINRMSDLATGEYLLKCDDHCIFGPGYDVILQDSMEEHWLVTPSRFRIDEERWEPKDSAVEYMFLTFPYVRDDLFGTGFHGKKWIGEHGIGENMGRLQYYWLENARRHVKIDDIQTMQGSCWFTTKNHFESIDKLDEVHSYFYQEANELCFKTWLSGGRCVLNKNTWYAHLHKSNSSGGRGLTLGQKHETERFQTWLWMNGKWPKATKPLRWFVNTKFWPIPTWPDNWQAQIKQETDFRVFDAKGHDGFKCTL